MIIADTGFFLALFNANDRLHPDAMKVLNTLSEPLITTIGLRISLLIWI